MRKLKAKASYWFCNFLWWLARKSARLAVRLELPRGIAWHGTCGAFIANWPKDQPVKLIIDSSGAVSGIQ